MINNLKTFLLLAGLSALFLGLGYTFGGNLGVVYALGFAVFMNGAAYWFSDQIALMSSHAQPLSRAEAPQLYAIVEGLCQRAHLPFPRIYLIPDATPNAFATGRNPQHAAVAVTQGILELLSPQELEGVLAHELGHVRNRDILTSSIAATLAAALTWLAHMAQWALMFGGLGGDREEDEGALGLIGGILFMLLAPLAAMLIQLAISRSREYQADATGARICGNPLALASALKKLEAYNERRPMGVATPETAHLYIVNPLSAEGLQRLFSTHPPIEERIERLEHMHA